MVRQTPEWISDAREGLLRLFIPGQGWAYGNDQLPSTEPTALACLALRASQPLGQKRPTALDTALRWLASAQQPSGAVGVSHNLPQPEWPTAHAILAWAGEEEHTGSTQKAIRRLLALTGLAYRDHTGIFGHDTTIAGWPWNVGTSPWIEPTAMAVLALRRAGLGGHHRATEGLRLIRDRVIPTGGWNYGNNTVYGTTLRPQPAATGLALAAVSGTCGDDATISSACAYLRELVAGLRAPQSLCWALLGLRSWGEQPPAASQWLEQAYEQARRRGPRAPQLSYLILAAGNDTPALLGIRTHASETTL